MAADDRAPKAIHAYLTADAHDAWRDFADTNGVSVSGLVEALAANLPAGEPGPRDAVKLTDLVGAARKIDAVRRRRGSGSE